MSLRDDLKALIIKKGWTMTKVVEELNERYNRDFTVQNLSGKMRRGTLKYTEVVEILDIIDYSIKWVDKNNSQS